MAKVKAVCISEHKGTKKHPVERITVKENHGIIGDAHAGRWHRQISLLAQESVDEMRRTGLKLHAGLTSSIYRSVRCSAWEKRVCR